MPLKKSTLQLLDRAGTALALAISAGTASLENYPQNRFHITQIKELLR